MLQIRTPVKVGHQRRLSLGYQKTEVVSSFPVRNYIYEQNFNFIFKTIKMKRGENNLYLLSGEENTVQVNQHIAPFIFFIKPCLEKQ